MRDWFKSGSPWIWLTAGAVALSVLAVAGVLALTALRGLGHFWPKAVAETSYKEKDGQISRLIGEVREREEVSMRRLVEAGFKIEGNQPFVDRLLFKLGNRDVTGVDFRWFPEPLLGTIAYPADLITIERREWGNFYGHLKAVKENGQVVASGEAAWPELLTRFTRAESLFQQIYKIEKNQIGDVNHKIEGLRLEQRRAELAGRYTEALKADLAARKAVYDEQFSVLQTKLQGLRTDIGRDTIVVEVMDGKQVEIKLGVVADV